MQKLLSLGVGLAIGAIAGVTLMILFAPVSGDQMKQNLREGWDDAMEEARVAAETRRVELEADLARRRGQAPPMLP